MPTEPSRSPAARVAAYRAKAAEAERLDDEAGVDRDFRMAMWHRCAAVSYAVQADCIKVRDGVTTEQVLAGR